MKHSLKTAIISLLSLIVLSVNAQDKLACKLTASPNIPSPKWTGLYYRMIKVFTTGMGSQSINIYYPIIFAVTKDSYYLHFMSGTEEHVIAKIDKNNKIVKTFKYNIKSSGMTYKFFQNAIKADNGIVIPVAETTGSYSVTGKKPVTIKVSLLKLDDDLNQIGNPEEVLTYNVPSGNFDSRLTDCFFRMSPDKSKIILLSDKECEDNKFVLHLVCYDKAMSKQWEKDVTIPYNSTLSYIRDAIIDNSGNVLFLVKAYNKKYQEVVNGKPNYLYRFYSLTEDGKTVNDLLIEPQDKFVFEPTYSFTGNGIAIGGFYSENSDIFFATTKGTYFICTDNALKPAFPIVYTDYSNDFVTKYCTEKDADKLTKLKSVETNGITLAKNIHTLKNGNTVISGQEYISINPGNIDLEHHFFGSIIAACYTPKGELVWISKIPHKDANGFYSMTQKNGDLYYVFVGDLHNLKNAEKEGLVYKRDLECVGIVSRINPDGEVEMYEIKMQNISLLDDESVDFSHPLDDSGFIYGCLLNQKYINLVKIEFE